MSTTANRGSRKLTGRASTGSSRDCSMNLPGLCGKPYSPKDDDNANAQEVSAGASRGFDAACCQGQKGRSDRSLNAAVIQIGQRVGVNPLTLQGWCKQAAIDAGERPGSRSGRSDQSIRGGESRTQASRRDYIGGVGFLRAEAMPATPSVIRFIHDHRDPFRIISVCRVLIPGRFACAR